MTRAETDVSQLNGKAASADRAIRSAGISLRFAQRNIAFRPGRGKYMQPENFSQVLRRFTQKNRINETYDLVRERKHLRSISTLSISPEA